MTTILEYHALTYDEKNNNPARKWQGATRHDGTRTALISCPVCGGVFVLSGHKIDGNGRVYPSVVCPFRGCKFHDHIILNGWQGEEQ
jgi:hypothetical protein